MPIDLNLTVSALAFNNAWSDKTGSERRETSRGANLPTVLSIKHQDYVDSATKVPGKRSVVRLDYYMTMTDGIIRPVSLYVVCAAPTDPLVTTTITNTMCDYLVNLLHGTTNTNGLGLRDEIFGDKLQ
jgi:hypothetical protein